MIKEIIKKCDTDIKEIDNKINKRKTKQSGGNIIVADEILYLLIPNDRYN